MSEKPANPPSEEARAEAGKTASKPVSSVLFVCTMNCIRSPMAESILKHIHNRRIFCDSAGTDTGEPDGFAIAVMKERGMDMQTHAPKTLDDLEHFYFDLIVTLSPQAHHRILDLTADQAVDIEYWPTMDPSTVAGTREQVLDAYRQVRDALETRIRQRFGD